MAEETPVEPTKKGGFFKKKVAGIPMPVVLIVGGVVIYVGYRWYKSRSTSTSSTATPTDTTGTATGTDGGYDSGTGGGYGGGGGGGEPSGGSVPVPNKKTNPTGQTATGAGKGRLTPIGAQTITVKGHHFNTVSGFTQGGHTYYGINNPDEAEQLRKLGVILVHNPNDPSGKGLFVMRPNNSATIPTSEVPTSEHPVATGSRTGTGEDYAGTGQSSKRPLSLAAIRERNAATRRRRSDARKIDIAKVGAQNRSKVRR